MRALDVRSIPGLYDPVVRIFRLMLFAVTPAFGVSRATGIPARTMGSVWHLLIESARVVLVDTSGTAVQPLPPVEANAEPGIGRRSDSLSVRGGGLRQHDFPDFASRRTWFSNTTGHHAAGQGGRNVAQNRTVRVQNGDAPVITLTQFSAEIDSWEARLTA